MPNLLPDSVSILGVDVSFFSSYDAAVALVRDRIFARVQTFCVAINPEKVYMAKRNPRLEGILRSADIRICDGIGISFASMFLHRRSIPRCTGIDLFSNLIRLCAKEGFKVFVLGASPDTNEAGCRVLMKSHPKLQIAGRHHGFIEDAETITNRINQSGADVLFVAMGSPRQEVWISEHISQLQVKFCMGIGGSLDVISGSVKRAPFFFRRTGTEWLYRLIRQPSRIRRQAVLPVFAMDVLKSMRHARFSAS